MIEIERVSVDWAKARVEEHHELIGMSFEIWAVKVDETLGAIIGAVRWSPLGPARIWLVQINKSVTQTFSFRRAMRDITREGNLRFGHLLAGCANEVDQRFAEFCGLKMVGMIGNQARMEI